MKRLLTIIRGSLHTIAYAVVLIAIALYFIDKANLSGMLVKHSLTNELSEQLGTKVTVDGEVEVDWLNQVVINGLTIFDQQDDTLLFARRVLVAYDALPLLSHHLVLNTCQLIDFDIHVNRPSADSVANYQFAIDALMEKRDPDSQPFIQHIDLNAILLRQGTLTYDVLDKPQRHDTPIDPYHLFIQKLSANVHVHNKLLQIKKFHCDEHNMSLKASKCDLSLDMMQLLKRPDGENHFILDLKGWEMISQKLSCKADVHVTSDEMQLQLKQLHLPFGLPQLKGVQMLQTSATLRIGDLRMPLDSVSVMADFQQLQVRLDTLGTIRAFGRVEGMPCHSQFAMNFLTDWGNADVSGQVELPYSSSDNEQLLARDVFVKGHCLTRNFELGKLIPKQQLGKAGADLDFSLALRAKEPLAVTVNGLLSHIDWKNHTYRGVQIEGANKAKRLTGHIVLKDSLVNTSADVDIDLSHPQQRYKIDGNVEHLNLNALHITNTPYLDSLTINGTLHADLLANNRNEVEGVINISDIRLGRGEKLVEIEPIRFEGTSHCGTLDSPIVHMSYSRNRRSQDYHLSGRISPANELFDLLQMPFGLNRVGEFDVFLDSTQHITQAHIDVPSIDFQQGRTLAATLDVKSNDEGILLPVLGFEALSQQHSLSGRVNGRVCLDPLDVDLDPTTFLFDKEELELTGAHLRRSAEGDLHIDNLQLKGGSQSLSASGKMEKNGEKNLIVNLHNFELEHVFGSLKKNYLHFGGKASGKLELAGKNELLLSTDDLKVENFSYIDTIVGDASFKLDYNIDKELINITCDIETDSIYHTHIDGDIQMGKNDSLDLRFYPDHLPLGFINNWTGSILQHLTGTVTGPARLYGSDGKLQLSGKPVADCRFTHQTIGANFHLKDTVYLEHNLLHLDNAWVDDCHGHPLTLNARIPHKDLSHFDYDVNIDMPDANQGFLVLDREQIPGRIYWGQIYAKGHANLQGANGKHQFNIKVSTTDKSWFYLSPREQDLNSDQSSYTLLTFRDKEKLGLQEADSVSSVEVNEEMMQSSKTDLVVNLDVQVTDQCQVTVQMDPLSDDKLSGRGNAELSILYEPDKDIQILGNYNITQGTYAMSMKGDLVNKVFQLKNTSNVKFKGLPSEADLQLDCRYTIPSVNLTDLDEGIVARGSLNRASVPVDCYLYITDKLASPQIRFDLEVKNVNDEVQAQVHNIIGTQEMLNQEVLYLLLFSKFYTPQYAQSSQSHTGSELTSLASSSLTSQLNQLLGHLSDNFSLGTNFHSDKGDFSDMEMDLSLSTRLLGDRLILNGNVGYRDPANRVGSRNNSTSLIGDFDLEYLVNNSGTIRAKAYSHYNERDYSINNALTTQGIGFILRRDFMHLGDLWPWNRRKSKARTAPAAKEEKK